MPENFLGESIPKLGFGLMRLPQLKGGEIDVEQTKKMADLFLERGFTYFDTAYVYNGGASEEAAREALVKRYPRESFFLADKLPVWSARKYGDFMPLFETSLRRTGVNYFDFYMLHSLDRGRLESLEKTGAWDFLQELKQKGLIRHGGFSFHDTADVLEEYLTRHPEAEFVQLQINYADWESRTVQSRLCYEVARKHDKPVIVMEPVKGGSLATVPPELQKLFRAADPNASPASWAVRFAASLPGVITVLSGMSNLAQTEDNTGYMQNFAPLSQKEKEVLDKAGALINGSVAVSCTGCEYCVATCPQKIDIPGIFSLYNEYSLYQNLGRSKMDYRAVAKGRGKASSCVGCAACEEHCPQHLSIVETLKKAADLFE